MTTVDPPENPLPEAATRSAICSCGSVYPLRRLSAAVKVCLDFQ